jgi:2-dehydropantoate 2-reductase
VLRDTPHAKAWFAVGPYDRQTEGREAEVVEVLRHSGRVEVYSDIRAAKWMKLIVNAAEVAPTAILDRSLAAAIETPGMRALMLKVGCEAIEVAKKASIPVVPMFGLPDLDPENPRAFIETLLDTIIYSYSQPNSKVAALQDWMKGRRSEIDDMNGAVVRAHPGARGSVGVGAKSRHDPHGLSRLYQPQRSRLDLYPGEDPAMARARFFRDLHRAVDAQGYGSRTHSR